MYKRYNARYKGHCRRPSEHDLLSLVQRWLFRRYTELSCDLSVLNARTRFRPVVLTELILWVCLLRCLGAWVLSLWLLIRNSCPALFLRQTHQRVIERSVREIVT